MYRNGAAVNACKCNCLPVDSHLKIIPTVSTNHSDKALLEVKPGKLQRGFAAIAFYFTFAQRIEFIFQLFSIPLFILQLFKSTSVTLRKKQFTVKQ